MASLFPRSFISHPSFTATTSPYRDISSPSSFHPLFRLLDDFDQYSRNNNTSLSSTNNERTGGQSFHHRTIMKSFTPNFDVKETADAYVLYGDLPGIEQKDIKVEFTDAETLTVRGRVERVYTSGTPPALPSSSAPDAIEESDASSVASKDRSRQPTVEDEATAVANAKGNNGTNTEESVNAKEEELPKEKYWVEERSVGQFQRSFTFPVNVDQDSVNASMRNGVLTIVVPKGKKVEPRQIHVH